MERQPYGVFLESWGAEMGPIPWTAPFPEDVRDRALHALRSGRWRAWSYARGVLGWGEAESVLACRFIELTFLHWLRTDGVDRDVLRARLHAAQERGRLDMTLQDHALQRADSVLELQLGQI